MPEHSARYYTSIVIMVYYEQLVRYHHEQFNIKEVLIYEARIFNCTGQRGNR